MAGWFCSWWLAVAALINGVREDAGGGLVECIGGVLFVVCSDEGEQVLVQDAPVSWLALLVEVVESDEEFGELIQAGSGVGVSVGEVIVLGGDLADASSDTDLFTLKVFEGDHAGVGSLDEFTALGF